MWYLKARTADSHVDMIVKYGYCYDSMSITRKRIDRRFDTKNVNIHKLMEIMMIVAVFRQMCSAKPIAVKIGCTLFYLNINDEIVWLRLNSFPVLSADKCVYYLNIYYASLWISRLKTDEFIGKWAQ